MNDDFSGYQDWLDAFNEWTDVSVSELHGLMTALVCTIKPPKQSEWQEILAELSFSIPNEQSLALLTEYGEDVGFTLSDKEDAYEFLPLVPDDDHDIGERLLALKDWAGGFITGIGVADIYLKDDEKQLLSDLSKIAALRVDEFFGGGETDEQDDDFDGEYDDELSQENSLEESYLHLFEFVRFVPVAFATRKKREVKELAIIKGLSQERKTANELKLPPVVNAAHKH